MSKHYLGVDIGSSFTKFSVIDNNEKLLYSKVLKTLSRNKQERKEVQNYISGNFDISFTCSTGYGRDRLRTRTLQRCRHNKNGNIQCISRSIRFIQRGENHC